tara:strand:- start:120 stop:812 length:693 start_codon:yes stop_codon:yes gene_type:complete
LFFRDKCYFAIFLSISLFFPFISHAESKPDNKEIEKVSAYLTAVSNSLLGDKNVDEFKISMNWGDNPQIQETKQLSGKNKLAAMWWLIENQEKNEDLAFSTIKDTKERQAFTLMTRLLSYLKFQSLLNNTSDFPLISSYLDNEIFDLKNVLQNSLNAEWYFNWNTYRKGRLDGYLFQDEQFARHVVTTAVSNEKPGPNTQLQDVSLIAFFISLSEVCIENMKFCANISIN